MAIVAKFRKMERNKCKAAITIDGLSGTGKTGAALALAYALTKDFNKVAAVDTENRSMDLYKGIILHTGVTAENVNIGDLTAEDGFKPSYYLQYRDLAIANGMECIINDSISHMWMYKGGVLDMVNEAQKTATNKYSVWGQPEITAEKNMIMACVRHPNIHCINTLRIKEKMELVQEDGKTFIKSLGEQQIIMPDFKYEPDLSITMLQAGTSEGTAPRIVVNKSRYSPFKVHEEYDLTPALMEQLRMFLEEGTSPEELLEMQRQDYIQALTQYLDEHSNARTVWGSIKENVGLKKDTKLSDMTLPKIKEAYSMLVS